MRRILTIALLLAYWFAGALSASADDVSGTWQGPWYRGMTSGTMTLEVDAAGAGTAQFTNLDNFGEKVVSLSRVDISDSELSFSAAGEGAGVFVATSRVTNDGQVLKGKALYEGFPIKFKLKRR